MTSTHARPVHCNIAPHHCASTSDFIALACLPAVQGGSAGPSFMRLLEELEMDGVITRRFVADPGSHGGGEDHPTPRCSPKSPLRPRLSLTHTYTHALTSPHPESLFSKHSAPSETCVFDPSFSSFVPLLVSQVLDLPRGSRDGRLPRTRWMSGRGVDKLGSCRRAPRPCTSYESCNENMFCFITRCQILQVAMT